MLECFIVRHGVTEENLNYTLIGRTDTPLHSIGRIQAQCLAEKLNSINFDAIYTSPLTRAVETADIILSSQKNGTTRRISALREIDLGIVDGVSSFTAYEQYKDLIDIALDPHVDDYKFPFGESRNHALRRFRRFLKALSSVHQNGKVCIITHGGIIGLWLAHLKGFPLGHFRNYQPQHASISHIALSPTEVHIINWNNTSHLSIDLKSAIQQAQSG